MAANTGTVFFGLARPVLATGTFLGPDNQPTDRGTSNLADDHAPVKCYNAREMNSTGPSSRKNRSNRPRKSAPSSIKRGLDRYHSQHRLRMHQAVENKIGRNAGSEILRHPLVATNDPPIITKSQELSELIDHVRLAGSFAYDTEFIGELSYYPHLCLIQVATTERVAVIDPLADLDLSQFWEVVADEDVEKVVHAGVQDLEPAFRHIGRLPKNVFDTQVAAGFAGHRYPLSLRDMVFLLLGARLDKGATFTQWNRRPLTATQLRYAADDVRCLPALRSSLADILESAGHTCYARAECAGLSDPSLYQFDPWAQVLRLRGMRSLSPRSLAVLLALVTVRDEAARRDDVPPRALIKDETLIALAKKQAGTMTELKRVSGLVRSVRSDYGDKIVQATIEAQAIPDNQLPSPEPIQETAAERIQIDSLWAVMRGFCMGQSIDPGLVASRQEISAFYRTAAAGNSLAQSPLTTGWRGQLIGPMLTEFLQGTATVKLNWKQGRLRSAVSAGNDPGPRGS